MSFIFKVLVPFLLLFPGQQAAFTFEMSGNLTVRKYQLKNKIQSKQKAYDQMSSDLSSDEQSKMELAKDLSELEAMLLSVEEQIKLGDEKKRLENEIGAKERAYSGMNSSLLLRGRKMRMNREISKLEDELFFVEEQIDREKARLLKFDRERNKGTELGYFYQLSEELRQLESEYREKRRLYAETNASWKSFLPFGQTGRLARELSELQDKIQFALEQLREQKKRASSYTREKAKIEKSNLAEILSEEDSLGEKVDDYASQNSYISNCIDRVPEGKEIHYSRFFNRIVCRKIPFFFDIPDINPAKYTILKREGRIVIKTSLYANYKGHFSNREKALEDIRETVPCMKDFYAKHGIELDLTIKEGKNPLDMLQSDHFINFYDERDKSTAKNWAIYVGHRGKKILTKNNRCSLFVHELGHSLGLHDTYPKSRCPDRGRIMPKDDMMRSGGYSNIHDTKFYPYAIEALLKPLCGEM